MRKLLLAVLVVAFVAAAIPAQATHESFTKPYVQAAQGDVHLICDLNDLDDGLPCLGGASFEGLSGGTYRVTVEDLNDPISGAFRVEPGGSTVDVCFPQTVEGVPAGGSILVWLDGVVFWATGQPCGELVLSQATIGDITATHV